MLSQFSFCCVWMCICAQMTQNRTMEGKKEQGETHLAFWFISFLDWDLVFTHSSV